MQQMNFININFLKCCFIVFYLIFNTQNVFAAQDKICSSRLIVGSGKDVQILYPFARKVEDCDITIDKNQKIHPTHIFNIKEGKLLHNISAKYPNKFKKIIFEHVGEGFASFVRNKNELNQLMTACKGMLKKEGVVIYESSRHASSYSDKYGNNIDFGIIRVVEEHYQALHKIYTEKKLNLPHQKFAFIKEKYEELFELHGFEITSILIKEDADYRLVHPTKTPHYYLEIIIRRCNQLNYNQLKLVG